MKRKPRKKKEQTYQIAEKRPRQYASEIMGFPKEERKSIFEKVPDHLKDLVKKHCNMIQMIRMGKFRRYK